jgi:hypothetical protein
MSRHITVYDNMSTYLAVSARTKRDVFLAEMAAAVPWPVLEAVIARLSEGGPSRRSSAVSDRRDVARSQTCISLAGQLIRGQTTACSRYNLSDLGAEEALYDIRGA